MNPYKTTCFIFFLIVSLFLSGCAVHRRGPADFIPAANETKPGGPTQVLLVLDEGFLFWTTPILYALEKHDSAWRQALDPVKAVAGRNGFAAQGEKREGDGRTPSGTFLLKTAFGYAPEITTRMPYRQAGSDDVWVDDPKDPDYNRWVKQNETRAASYEKMKREDDLYQYGLVIEYNTDPIVPGYGSAIFLHVWKDARTDTAGCIAVSEADILKILAWLDPEAHPEIIINPDKNALRRNHP